MKNKILTIILLLLFLTQNAVAEIAYDQFGDEYIVYNKDNALKKHSLIIKEENYKKAKNKIYGKIIEKINKLEVNRSLQECADLAVEVENNNYILAYSLMEREGEYCKVLLEEKFIHEKFGLDIICKINLNKNKIKFISDYLKLFKLYSSGRPINEKFSCDKAGSFKGECWKAARKDQKKIIHQLTKKTINLFQKNKECKFNRSYKTE